MAVRGVVRVVFVNDGLMCADMMFVRSKKRKKSGEEAALILSAADRLTAKSGPQPRLARA